MRKSYLNFKSICLLALLVILVKGILSRSKEDLGRLDRIKDKIEKANRVQEPTTRYPLISEIGTSEEKNSGSSSNLKSNF